MKNCLICNNDIEKGKYCCDACRKEGAKRKQAEYYQKNKSQKANYNSEYYKSHQDSIKAERRLAYAANSDVMKERSHDYYMKNHTKWAKYNAHNHAANIGTGSLGAHKSHSDSKELEFIQNEMRRIGL